MDNKYEYINISGDPTSKDNFYKYAVVDKDTTESIEIVSWNPVNAEKSTVTYSKDELIKILGLFK